MNRYYNKGEIQRVSYKNITKGEAQFCINKVCCKDGYKRQADQ